ncbi:MAG: hypothetical protein ACPG19_15795 [Saprospiraceae bacterium]
MNKIPIQTLKLGAYTKKSNQISGVVLSGIGIFLAAIIFQQPKAYHIPVIGSMFIALGLYFWNLSTRQVLLFKYEILFKTLFSTKKIPLDSSTHTYIGEVLSSDEKTSTTSLFIITPTQNKELILAIYGWGNYNEFLTSLHQQIALLATNTPYTHPTSSQKKRQSPNQKKRRFSPNRAHQKHQIKGISQSEIRRFKKQNKSNRLSNTYEKNGVKVIRTGTAKKTKAGQRKLVKKHTVSTKNQNSDEAYIKIGVIIGFYGLILAVLALLHHFFGRSLGNNIYIYGIFLGIGLVILYAFFKKGED